MKPQTLPVAAALGATFAADVVAAECPPRPIALRDGYAVEAAAVADAGPYAPVVLPMTARRIGVGEPLPRDTDAVLPLDAIVLRGAGAETVAEAVAALAAGEGVLLAGGDATPQVPLRRAGERLRAIDLAVIAASGVSEVTVRRPRFGIVCGGAMTSPVGDAARAMLSGAIGKAGGMVCGQSTVLEGALADADLDAVIAVGGTGSGPRDAAVRDLARTGRVEAHGIAASPGETAAFGFAGGRPVLLIPGRLDAALALWLLIGRPLAAALAGGKPDDTPTTMPLKRKVTSTIGMTELIPVRCAGGMAEPLGSGYLSFTALTCSDGCILRSCRQRRFSAGTQVTVRPWP